MVSFVLAVCLAVMASSVNGLIFGKGPTHASCKVDWTFGMSCDMVKQKLVTQMNTWQGPSGCAQGGEKCLYAIKSQTSTEIKGTHTTPVKHYVDDLTFTLTPSGTSCNVHGFSTSETWYAVLDYSTNYCNMHNLITGSGLNTASGYTETTSDSICTQYSSANCQKY